MRQCSKAVEVCDPTPVDLYRTPSRARVRHNRHTYAVRPARKASRRASAVARTAGEGRRRRPGLELVREHIQGQDGHAWLGAWCFVLSLPKDVRVAHRATCTPCTRPWAELLGEPPDAAHSRWAVNASSILAGPNQPMEDRGATRIEGVDQPEAVLRGVREHARG